MALTTGNMDFKVIDIDPQLVANAFQAFLDRGTKITGVSLDDIDTSVARMPADARTATLSQLLQVGMKLFDAVVWMTAGRPATHPLRVAAEIKEDKIPSMATLAKSLVYCFFFLLTQARYPMFNATSNVASATEGAPRVPNFLKTILGMREDQSHYMGMLTSFPPEQFNPSWVRHVTFNNFGQEILARFGLGVAGYRMFGPFKLYTAGKEMTPALENAFQFAKAVAEHEPTWDIHPLTRNPAVLTARGNLNKNLGNLILDCFTDEQIAEMVETRILYARPMREASHRNYKTWSSVDTISGNTNIFPH